MLCCAVLCCAVLYYVMLCCAVLYYVMLCCAVLCCAVLCCAVLCHAVQYYVSLRYNVPSHAMPYYTVLDYAMLYHAMSTIACEAFYLHIDMVYYTMSCDVTGRCAFICHALSCSYRKNVYYCTSLTTLRKFLSLTNISHHVNTI